jgi:uncharacterized SAM-binding protein YcdF (DUF218 family)
MGKVSGNDIHQPGYDAILVLGGGVRDDGELPDHAKRRFDLALARESGEPIVSLSAWTAHRPAILDSHGRFLFESTVGARYLIDHGITADRIFCETTAYDTIGNAYFSRLQIVEPMGWKRLLIITSRFHMPRTEAIFRWIYGLDAPVPYNLEFAASANDGLNEAALSARMKKEETSLRSVLQLRERLTSLRALAAWLFTEHEQYRPVREAPPQNRADLLQSY